MFFFYPAGVLARFFGVLVEVEGTGGTVCGKAWRPGVSCKMETGRRDIDAEFRSDGNVVSIVPR